ncbi:hypothetical protein ACEN2T_17255 [Pseudomonas sp. W22_MBD1_FP4]|uniref:hypothetical protein n=1 Tax=Pseudomonas sp. W22_MBD1_FP4 TaxID=3240272 RepID=UPI003F994813
MNRITLTSLNFAIAVFLFGFSVLSANLSPSTSALAGFVCAITGAAVYSYLFMRSALLCIRDCMGEQQIGITPVGSKAANVSQAVAPVAE